MNDTPEKRGGTRRYDPERRDRIIDAALAVIAEGGVAGTSHRRVAERAGVPLGSMTYHFTSMDELLREAFTRFATRMSAHFTARIAAAADLDALAETVVQLVHEDLAASPEDLVISLELYTLAARQPAFRQLTHDWMRQSRQALERLVDARTAYELDALIEGLFIHTSLDSIPRSRAVTRDAVRRILSL
ncbi:TetR/AcrR family transcriptional regulator [Archangium primigenium]|uniref:TetR/AcrR family transcriptional regulator n=1 Tax=[Archangium] primigenium TaxID=2792470 RepID=UPI00195770E6|nr:TetR family transcriptional regulator [Archangium primigenium]MBM7116251.1 TetR family transcriptional regulator [Archangium primigenium]